MAGSTARKIFTQSFKTAAIANQGVDAVIAGYGAYSNLSCIGFQLYQPYNLYAVKKMTTHFKCTFAASVTAPQQVISKISLGSINGYYPSTTTPYQNVNFTPSNGVLEFTMDLTPLITPTGDDIIYLYFPLALAPGQPGFSGTYSQIQIEVWKVDMLYEVWGMQ